MTGLAGIGAVGMAGFAGAYLGEVPVVQYSAATVLGLLGAGCVGGAVVARRRFDRPEQRFRRELGDPAGWLDHDDYDRTAGAEAVARIATGRPAPPQRRMTRRCRSEAIAAAERVATRYGFCPGTLVSGPPQLYGRRVYAPWSRGVCLLGPQGSGKSQLLIHIAVDSPAATVINSTKPELAEATQVLRARIGPTMVFNPLGVGALDNTCCWDPVAGCGEEAAADRRAWALVRGAGGAGRIDRSGFWAGKAVEVLRCYLMAAALGRYDMSVVARWVNNPDTDRTALGILETDPRTPSGWADSLRTIISTVKETRDGFYATATSAVAFADAPAVRTVCCPSEFPSTGSTGRSGPTDGADNSAITGGGDVRGGTGGFDVATFLAARATLYMIGSDADQRLAPLFTAFTEEIFHQAKQVAATQPGGRLVEPLNLLLDEVAHMTPVPLHTWAGDSRGWGITVVAVIQARSQLASTWGEHDGDTIWRNLPTRLVLPGVNDQSSLEELSYLAGHRLVRDVTDNIGYHSLGTPGSASASSRVGSEPVINGPTIAGMPPGHVLAFGLGRHPAILAYEPGVARVTRELTEAAAAPRTTETSDLAC